MSKLTVGSPIIIVSSPAMNRIRSFDKAAVVITYFYSLSCRVAWRTRLTDKIVSPTIYGSTLSQSTPKIVNDCDLSKRVVLVKNWKAQLSAGNGVRKTTEAAIDE